MKIEETQETITIYRDENGRVRGFILNEPLQMTNGDYLPLYTSYRHVGGGRPFTWVMECGDLEDSINRIREELGMLYQCDGCGEMKLRELVKSVMVTGVEGDFCNVCRKSEE